MWLNQVIALLVLSVLVTESLAASVHKRPFRSIKAPIETVVNYDAVVPNITYKDSNEIYPKEVHVTLTTSEESFSLVLEKNEMLLSKNFVSRYYDDSGREMLTKGIDNCYYQGYVENQPDWIVTMVTCHGLQGEFGDASNEDKLYHIEPMNKEDKSLSQVHALYLDSEYKMKEGGCGCNHSSSDEHHGMDLPNLEDVEHNIQRRQATRFVELLIVNDNRQYVANGRNLEATVRRAVAIVNRVNSMYLPLGIAVVIKESITWTNGDRISSSSDPNTLLDRFEIYMRQITSARDASMLLTGIELNGNTVGIAFLRTMCNDLSSVGLTQDGGRGLSGVSTITAHELGHIFNMEHDRRSCSCSDSSGRCIMAASIGFPAPTTFSTCSVDDLNEGFNRFRLDRCLFNEPTMTVGDPVCGNGIREGDEVCDCGSPSECNDPCCNPRTCRLAAGAECSHGECCTSSCKLIAYGTTCRASNGDCDIAEYCTGESGDCPTDEHKIDRTPCNNNAGFCFSGSCPTHNEQCSLAFGSSKGHSECYSQLNIRGNVVGNCGSTSSNYIACAAADVQCGQLQCTSGQFIGPVLGFTNIRRASVLDQATRRFQSCSSFTTNPGEDFISPGLVLDGTKCGNGRVCEARRCVPATITNQCGRGSNGQICSGNGVCNNRGRCSCNIGFIGSVCQTPTTGADVNECQTNNGGCDHVCTNTDGSFFCSCNSGYTLALNGRTCNDINECNSNNGGCSQICTNTAGSFRCSCRSGYSLSSNGRTCNDINECSSNNGGCEQICTNIDGSFRCSCRSGFTLHSDGRTCTVDIVIPPTPIGVQAFCSAVNWRTSLSSCENTIASYEVQFYVPGTSQRVTRTISGSKIFHYVIGDQDTFNVPESTLVRVRARNSAGVSDWSSGVSLGCRDECTVSTSSPSTPSPSQASTPPPSTQPPSQAPTEPPSVYFTLRGKTYFNNSVITLTDVGEGENGLLCMTNKVACCGSPNRFGEFYYPNGNRVPNNAAGENFYRGRGAQVVRLSRRSGATSPRGVFRCEVPDNSGETQRILIRLN